MKRVVAFILVFVLVVAMPLSVSAATLSRPVFTTQVHEAVAWAKTQSGATNYYAVFVYPKTSIDYSDGGVWIAFYSSKSAPAANMVSFCSRTFEKSGSMYTGLKLGTTVYDIGSKKVSNYAVIHPSFQYTSGASSFADFGFLVEDISTWVVPSATLSLWRTSSLTLNVGLLPKSTELTAIISSMQNVSGEYTMKTWDVFQKALNDAVALKDKGYWFEDEVLTAIDTLDLAYKALVRITPRPDGMVLDSYMFDPMIDIIRSNTGLLVSAFVVILAVILGINYIRRLIVRYSRG